jgi:NADH-quinone oxidoreductase subunit J
LAGVIGAVIAVELALVLMRGHRQSDAPVPSPQAVEMGNTKLLGIDLYTNYLYPLQLAAVLLLVAIIAAIALTLRARKDSRTQDPGQQVKARKADRLRIVRMPPVVDAPPAPATPPAAPGGPTP